MSGAVRDDVFEERGSAGDPVAAARALVPLLRDAAAGRACRRALLLAPAGAAPVARWLGEAASTK